jgi:hypothetical protein
MSIATKFKKLTKKASKAKQVITRILSSNFSMDLVYIPDFQEDDDDFPEAQTLNESVPYPDEKEDDDHPIPRLRILSPREIRESTNEELEEFLRNTAHLLEKKSDDDLPESPSLTLEDIIENESYEEEEEVRYYNPFEVENYGLGPAAEEPEEEDDHQVYIIWTDEEYEELTRKREEDKARRRAKEEAEIERYRRELQGEMATCEWCLGDYCDRFTANKPESGVGIFKKFQTKSKSRGFLTDLLRPAVIKDGEAWKEEDDDKLKPIDRGKKTRTLDSGFGEQEFEELSVSELMKKYEATVQQQDHDPGGASAEKRFQNPQAVPPDLGRQPVPITAPAEHLWTRYAKGRVPFRSINRFRFPKHKPPDVTNSITLLDQAEGGEQFGHYPKGVTSEVLLAGGRGEDEDKPAYVDTGQVNYGEDLPVYVDTGQVAKAKDQPVCVDTNQVKRVKTLSGDKIKSDLLSKGNKISKMAKEMLTSSIPQQFKQFVGKQTANKA